MDGPEKELQEQHEANTLMVVYTDLGSIPDTPREPSKVDEVEGTEDVRFGDPPSFVKVRLSRTFLRNSLTYLIYRTENYGPSLRCLLSPCRPSSKA